MRVITPMKVLAVLVSAVAGLIAFVYFETNFIAVKRVTVKDGGIPPGFTGVTIAFISDIHHGPHRSIERVTKLVEKVNNLHPDLIVLGGDYTFRGAEHIEPCFGELGKLEAPLGVYGVLGNHDHWYGAEQTWACMHKAGITALDNVAFWITRAGGRIKLGGVGDLWEDTQDIIPTTGDTRDEDFVILVAHNPDYAEELATAGVDLMLSGHTHGGQITLFGIWAPLLPSFYGQKYRTGIIQAGRTKVIVSNGIGAISPAIRLFARSQIYLIRLEKS